MTFLSLVPLLSSRSLPTVVRADAGTQRSGILTTSQSILSPMKKQTIALVSALPCVLAFNRLGGASPVSPVSQAIPPTSVEFLET